MKQKSLFFVLALFKILYLNAQFSNGTFDIDTSFIASSMIESSNQTILVGNFVGNGNSCLMVRSDDGLNNFILAANNGGKLSKISTTDNIGAVNDEETYTWLVGDFDGDGIDDLALRDVNADSNKTVRCLERLCCQDTWYFV